MRLALALVALLPVSAAAESFSVPTVPEAVTLYADAGLVTRRTALTVPAGRHQVVLPGLPRSVDPGSIRLSLDGATLGTVEFRTDAVPPRPLADRPEIVAARARVDAAEAAIDALDDAVARARLPLKGAEARVQFLQALGGNDSLGSEIESLRALSTMVAQETQVAEAEILRAEQEIRRLNQDREDLERALSFARAALDALTPTAEESAQLTVGLSARVAGPVEIELSYAVGASWQPVYDIYLEDTELRLRRGAQVSQWSGEGWTDVALTLSTFRLNDRMTPTEVFPIPLRFHDPEAPQPKLQARAQSGIAESAMMDAAGAPVAMEETARPSFDGPGVTYEAPAPVTVASGVDAVRVALDTLSFEAERIARAAPRFDETAYLVAKFTNDTREPLLPAGDVALYRNGALVGRSFFERLPAGGETELAFGAIEALRLSYTVLDEAEADRGLINRSNTRTEAVRMEIENLGQTDWDVQVRAAVPYAVQEDLEIDWRAEPMPEVEDVEDQRGVLECLMPVPAGTDREIRLETDITWPEGMVLR